jgi:hypothetical protein
MRDLLDIQDKVLQLARANIRAQDERNVAERTAKVNKVTEYPDGSWVLYSGEGSITAGRSKLDTIKAGPFQVKSHDGPKYVITDVVKHKDREVHVTKLHPFRYDPTKTDPIHIARLDSREFAIAEVIDHQSIVDPEDDGRKRRRHSELWFLVRWAGFPTQEDSWEPFKSIRDTEALHTYLVKAKMTSYIPQKFKAKKPRSENEIPPTIPRRSNQKADTANSKRKRGRPKKSRDSTN